MKCAHILLITACVVAILTISINVMAISRAIHAEWEYTYNGNTAGFRLYQDNMMVCESTDPGAISMDCTIDAPDGESLFTMTAFLQNGTESEHSDTFSYIFSSSLKASISADPTVGESPLLVTFDASASSGNILAYEWVFGDGDTGSGNIVDHAFTSAGNYTVILRVTDDTGATDQENISIIATTPSETNSPPTAVIQPSTRIGDAPLEILFDGTDSSDEDGTILSHEWSLGDGGTNSGPQITYIYSSAGIFNAALTVTDDGGLTDTVSTPIIASEPQGGENIPPTAVISASANSGFLPLKLSFDGGNSTDPDGEIQTYTWNFGDGSSATGVTTKHTYLQTGVYTVTLKVKDNMGALSEPARYKVTVRDKDGGTGEPPEDSTSAISPIYILLLNNGAPANEPGKNE